MLANKVQFTLLNNTTMLKSKTNQFRLLILFLILCINYIIFCRNRKPYDYSNIPVNQFTCDTKSHHRDKFLTSNFFTLKSSGGLGNQLFETFSILGIAKNLQRIPFFNTKDRDLIESMELLSENVPRLLEDFLLLPIEIDNATRFVQTYTCCSYETHPLLKCEQSKYLVIEGAYFQSFKYFEHLGIDNIKNYITSSKSEFILNYEKHEMIPVESSKFKICVHIRRGDFLQDQVHEGSDSRFIRNAMEFLRKKFEKNTIFYVFGNDPKWVEEELKDLTEAKIEIMRTPPNLAIADLKFSIKHCDSVLITAPSSTFGWWLGFLSKNQENVFYRDIYETNDQVKYELSVDDFYPKTWNKLGMRMEDGEIFGN
ncbi:unnamed protein product [Caenorhabditis angaria]|uniref:L-Fucosyltransferase n=1 Tax=Caenorhabditis angaria TaxID=860376 RepID=A0A9P1I6L2_9PELO|nr:unnamed protein product [Caenorhabditis angaria]